MRSAVPLVMAAWSCQASARWLALTRDIRGGDLSRPSPTSPSDLQKQIIMDDSSIPKPTPPPADALVELLLHKRDSSSSTRNTWENSNTCGWYSGLSSKPYVCESPLSCATNTDNVVACSTEGVDEFYTICFNYEAVQSSKCTSAGPKTGCCQNSDEPECGTFIWTGTPARSMYKCFATPTIISMLDKPQFVIDASSSSSSAAAAASSSSAAAASSSSAAAAASRSSASAAAQSSQASEVGGSSVTITRTASDGSSTTFTAVAGATGSASYISSLQYTSTATDGSTTTYTAIAQSGTDGNDGSDGGGSGSNTGAIAGGIAGGIGGLLLLLLLLWYLMKKKNNKFSFTLCGGKRKTNKEKHVHNKTYNENNVKNDDHHYGLSDSSPKTGRGGFSLSLAGGGKKSTNKEENMTNNYYYGDKVRNDNRLYDKRSHKDNRRYSIDNSRSVTPSQQPQNFHFEVGGGPHEQRRSGSAAHSLDDSFVGVGALGGVSRRNERRRQQERVHLYDTDSRSPSPAPRSAAVVAGGGSSRREKRRQRRRQERRERGEPESDSEPEYEAETSRGRTVSADQGERYEPEPQQVHLHVHVHDRERDRDQDADGEQRRPERTHRYHPTSGHRHQRSITPPRDANETRADDFIGRGL